MASSIREESREASEALLAEAARWIPGGVNSARRRGSYPLCVRTAEGAYIEDMEGRRYLDYHAAYSAINLGHGYPAVTEAVRAAIGDGNLYGLGVTEGEVGVAKKLAEHVPAIEKSIVCNSGSEATYHAVRLARGVTGREKILKFGRNYHGFHDYVIARTQESANAQAGILKAAGEATVVASYNELETVEQAFAENDGEIACIIVEPIVHNSPGATILPRPGFLEGLRAFCDRHGAILIFDEVISGFRHGLGGYQKVAGVTPDLTTLGKAIANGFPIAALGGKASILDRFSTNEGGDVFLAGTYSGNKTGTSAALATIGVLEDPASYEHTFSLGEQMREGLRAITKDADVPTVVTGFGATFVLGFMEGPIETAADLERNDIPLFLQYRRELVARGVLELPEVGGSGRNCISLSHSQADIDRTLEIAEEAFALVTGKRGDGQH
jgi:glutamate-1-semialdehyde 2,1-aminomutase